MIIFFSILRKISKKTISFDEDSIYFIFKKSKKFLLILLLNFTKKLNNL